MKVIIVTPYFYPHVGGVEAYTLNMALQLKEQGWQVVIVTTGTSKDSLAGSKMQGLQVYRLKTAFRVSNTPIGFFWKHKLRRIYKIEKPDIINAHTPVPYLADVAERASGSIPFVLTYHNDIGKDTLVYKQIVRLLHFLIIGRTMARSDRIIATSEYYVNHSELLKEYSKKISIVSPGVDLTRFNPQISSKELTSRYKDKRIILFVGSINKSQKHKGVDVLIRAFGQIHAEHSDTKLVIVGSGDALPLYREQALEAGLENDVEFTGYISDKKLSEYYKKASVLTLPSTNENEGFGMVFIEAGAVGIPVVGSKVGGIPYAIQDHQTGLLVKPKSVASLRSALHTILTNPELARQLGKAGAARAVKEFDWRLLAKKTDAIFRDAIKPTIVQVAGYYPPHLGGMEKVVQVVSENFAARGYQTQVLTTSVDKEKMPAPVQANLQIKRFKAFQFAHTPIAPAFLFAIFNIPKRSVVHLHLAQAYYPELVLLASRARNIPYIVHFHLDLHPTGHLGRVFLLYKRTVLSHVIQKANAVVVFSDEQRIFIHSKYGVDLRNIYVIANGVGSEYFRKPQPAQIKDRYKLLYVGRLQAQKRINILIDMVAALKEKAELTIVGNGEDRRQLERNVQTLKLSNIHFKGQVAPRDILSYYRAADMFVIASENEGMPLAVLEAMASSLPIVSVHAPGLSELLQGVGCIVEETSAIPFAKSVDALLQDSKRREALAAKSYSQALSYTWPATIDALEELYMKVMA